MTRRIATLAALGALTAAAPAQAGVTELLDTTLTATTKAASCIDGRVAGAAARTLRAPAEGYLSLQLTGARGDWDVAAFDEDGRRVAGAASAGASELAQGFVRQGQRLTVQACGAGDARLVATLAQTRLDTGITPKLVEIDTPTRESIERLQTMGLDLTEHGEDGHRGAVLYTAAEERRLREAGFTWRTTVADLAEASREQRAADRAFAAAQDGSDLPSGSEGYRRLADIQQEMKDLAAAHPTLVKRFTLPLKSLEGRDIEGIEITPDVNAKDGKPVFLMTGVHHAREWPSAENPLEFAYDLIKGYGKDPRTTGLLDRARVVVVPVVNVDGFNLSREAPDDGTLYEYKRKNCRTPGDAVQVPGVCSTAPEVSGTGVGVDPNRNWGGDWGGPGAATDPAGATYRGSGPFSEPEVENIRRLIASRQVTTFITNHTHGSLILRPPGIAAFGLAKDEGLLKTLGDAMAEHNGYTSQYSWQLYDTSGTAEAWSYYATGGLGYTFEIHGGNFHRAYEDAVVGEYLGPTLRDAEGGNREAYFTALASTVDESRHAVIGATAPAGATLTLTKTFGNPTSHVQPPAAILPWGEPRQLTDTLTTTYEVPKSGRVELHVNPSTRPDVYGGRLAKGPTTPDVTFSPTATTTRAFTVKPDEDNAGVRVRVDSGAPGDDWSVELFKREGADWVRQARSAVANRSFEIIETHLVPPGDYEVRLVAQRANMPATVKVDFLAPEPPEAWTLSCTPAGATAPEDTRPVIVDRGDKRELGRLCK